ncbi:hypothetical protein PMZ80_001980 [Knufia obscura]|uniref:F-box domain-containing protein n=1 Tax=Knufia obscura TaxID=1635080 RepID=A0ABR0RWU7_9EURO|nr:hypothetical protein PMZ80_001980 [Knufia obscura]
MAISMKYNNNRLPSEILKILMEYVSSTCSEGSCFNLSALLTCRSWTAAGLAVLWRDVVHQQPGRVTERTVILAQSISQSAVAREHMVSFTVVFGDARPEDRNYNSGKDEDERIFPRKPAMAALFSAITVLSRLQSLSIEFGEGMRADVVLENFEILVTTIPQSLENLRVKVRFDWSCLDEEILSLDGHPPDAISKAAQQLRKLSLELPIVGIGKFLPINLTGHYPCPEEVHIAIEPGTFSFSDFRKTHDCIATATKTIRNDIKSAESQARLPQLRAASIITKFSHASFSRWPLLSDVQASSFSSDVMLQYCFSIARDVFWAQVAIPSERLQSLEDRHIFLARERYRPSSTAPDFELVQLVDTLPNILAMGEPATWIETPKGTKVPLSLLKEHRGRYYRISREHSELQARGSLEKRHEEITLELAAYPDIFDWIHAQAAGTSSKLRSLMTFTHTRRET